jgi:hypothetical protein
MNAARHATAVAALAVLLNIAGGAAEDVRAAVLFDSGAVSNAGLASDAGGFFVRAADFVLSPGASTVTGVAWKGDYANGTPHNDDDFTIQFFENAPAMPPGQLFDEPEDVPLAIRVIDVTDANRVPSGDVFDYSISIAPLALLPNTRYWVSIFNDASDETTGWLWRGQTSTNNALRIGVRNNADFWGIETGRVLDFQLLGEVPEPSGIGLLLAGLSMIFARRSGRRLD